MRVVSIWDRTSQAAGWEAANPPGKSALKILVDWKLGSTQRRSACTSARSVCNQKPPAQLHTLTPVLAAHHTSGSSRPSVHGQDVQWDAAKLLRAEGMRLTETVELGVLVP